MNTLLVTKETTTIGPKAHFHISLAPLQQHSDIMGLERVYGVLMDDVKLALMGHVKDGYVFNPHKKMSNTDPHFNLSPTDNNKVHVLVCVVPADTIGQMSDDFVGKIRAIRLEAHDLGIHQVAIITKIDMTFREIRNDLKKVYLSSYAKEKMEELSANVGIPMNCIFPVKNYTSEINLNNDSLILSSLQNIINFGDDSINFSNKTWECSA